MTVPGLYHEPSSPLALPGHGRDRLGGIAPPADERLNLRHLLNVLRRRRPVFLLSLALVLSLGALITAAQQRSYEASAVVLLTSTGQQLEEKVTDRPGDEGMQGDADVSTEIQVIGSLDLARRVTRALKLVENARFNPFINPPQSLTDRLLGTTTPGIDLAKLTPAQRQQMEEDLVRYVRRGLGASRIGTSYSVQLTYTHHDPELAAMIANGFAQEYTRAQMTDKKDSTGAALKFLGEKVEELRGQATADFAAVQGYRVSNGLLSTSGTTLTEQDISVYNQQTATARAEAAADQARLDTARRQLRSGSAGDDVGEALSSPVVSSLRAQRAQIGARVADLTARYGSRHPELQRAQKEIASVDAQIQEEIDRVISNLEAKAAVSAQRLASLNGSLGSARGELARNNKAMVALDDLQRRAEASQGLYESYLARYRQLAASSGTERPEARVLTEASIPVFPASPNVPLTMALAALIGLVVGLVLAFLAEMQFRGVTTAEDVERRTGLPCLGLTPENGSMDHAADGPMETLSEQPNSVLAESLRGIYAATHMPVAGRGRVLAVTSALPGEGKTILSALLGKTGADMGARTVVVDCDIILRGLSRLSHFKEGPGIREIADGTATLDQALRSYEGGLLSILPIVSAGEAGERLTRNGTIQSIVAQLKERFDLIILDCPPLLAIAEAREIAGLADGAILAMQWRKTPDDAVRSAARLLPQRLNGYTGVVLSRVDLRKQERYAQGEAGSYTTAYQNYVAAAA